MKQSSGRRGSGRSPGWLAAWALRPIIACGLVAMAYYFSFWAEHVRPSHLLPALLLFLAATYAGAQILANWFLYLAARRPATPPAPPAGLTVDVFVTTCHEPCALVEKTLAAACALTGSHATWLLDDGADPALARLAARLGAGYLTRLDQVDAKAGNLNAALADTQGDVVVIFDVDHTPRPDFLQKTLGCFADPRVGFVQVMVTFNNSRQSWVAAAAMETSLEFYNPTALGTDAVGSATLMGSNALIRREALRSIGGYRPGLAEDLATSLALHAAGWRSAYVQAPLAPGIAPPDLPAWFTQQLKWARGVFEMLLQTYPGLFPRLTWGQRLSYAVRMTRYWIGPVVALHLLATIWVLMSGDAALQVAFHAYLLHLAPLAACDVLIQGLALRAFRPRELPRTPLLRAVTLVYFTWPVYTLAWCMAVFRLPLRFRPTPKTADGRVNAWWLLPQILAAVLLLAGAVAGRKNLNGPSLLLVFAGVQAILQLIVLAYCLFSALPWGKRNAAARAAGKADLTPPQLLARCGDLERVGHGNRDFGS